MKVFFNRILNFGITGNQVSLEEKHSIKLINQISFFIIVLTTIGDIGEITKMGWQLILHTLVFKFGFILVLYLNFKRKTNAASLLFSSTLLFELCIVPFLVPHSLNADGLFLSIIVIIGAVLRKAKSIVIFAFIDLGILISWHVADSYFLIKPMNDFKPEEYLFIEISYSIVMMAALLIGLLSFKRSATEFQAELTQTNLSLESANKDLERQHLLNQKIFSVISHDFRGPMLALSLMLDKFKIKNEDAVLNNYVKDISSELNNLLNWARTEINIKSFEKKEASINEIFNELAREFKNRLMDKKIQIVNHIPTNSTINLPPDILRIALRNLISNAIKFSYENNTIEILFANNILSVKDFGFGMNKDLQNNLFKSEVETRLGSNNEEGFGMGLYIVSELLNKYDFKISVESEIEKGTIFSMQST